MPTASIIAGLTTALFSVVGEFDEISAEVLPDGRVRYKYLTSGLPIEQIAEIKAKLWSVASLPAKLLKITDVKIVEQGPVFARFLVTAETLSAPRPPRPSILRRRFRST